MAENHCSGTIEKPVTRSKFRRINWYTEYLDSPAWRCSWLTSISTGFEAKVYASAGIKVFTSRQALMVSITLRS
ncbi:hypothetical protein D3C72_2407810 [compost metagenome]